MALLDEMISCALDDLLAHNEGQRHELLRRMCQRWPEESALTVCFALTSAAAMIDDCPAKGPVSDYRANFAYKIAAVLAADIFAAEHIAGHRAKAGDLLQFWHRVDPYYVEQ